MNQISPSAKDIDKLVRLAYFGQYAVESLHDINNTANFFAASLSSFLVNSKRHSEAAQVSEAVNHLDSLQREVRSLMSLYKSNWQRTKQVALGEAVLACTGRLSPVLEWQRITLTMHIDRAVERELVPGTLTVIIAELIKNSIRSLTTCARAERTIRISSEQTPKGVGVIIQDNGVGIMPQQIARVWDPFFTTSSHCIGLGLPFVKLLVTEAGGTVEIQSLWGYDCTVRLDLPPLNTKNRGTQD